MRRLVLASQSPRRRELLALTGHPFDVIVSNVEETSVPGESPAGHVTRLASLKAADVASRLDDGIVIGSDTVVVLNGYLLEKPVSKEDAIDMLMSIQGHTHRVFTGYCIHDAADGRSIANYETTAVTMGPMTRAMAREYVATNEPMDKAGSYGIQGYGAVLVTSIEGCYFTVMGLPLAKLMQSLFDFTGGEFGFFGTRPEVST